jgi:hypothetical protein
LTLSVLDLAPILQGGTPAEAFRHSFGSSFDRSTTHYFVVARTTSREIAERQRGVRGPLTEKEFAALTTVLSLPQFSKTFADLE